MRGTPGTGISQKIKNLKYTGQSILSKKMTALKAKLTDTSIPAIEVPKNGGESPKKSKRYRFRRTVSDSNSMAELLVRSVIQVHSSLDCIMETHDGGGPPVLQKQMSLNESSSKENSERKRKSGSYLSLPGDSADAPSSNASDISETSTSEEEEPETKDTRIDYDTISAIVKNVRRMSRMQHAGGMETGSMQSVQIEDDSNDDTDEKGQWQFDTTSISSTNENRKFSYHSGDDDKFNNNQITTIAEKEENDETEFENKSDTPELIQWKFEDIPCDYPDKKILFSIGGPAEEGQVPPKAEFDDFSLESSGEEEANTSKPEKKMIIPPVMMGADIQDKGLVRTAVEMLLLDKINLMSTYTPPTSPTATTGTAFPVLAPARSNSIDQQRDQSFYPKITEAFETIRRSSTQSLNHHMKGGVRVVRKISAEDSSDPHRSLLSLQDHNHQIHENVLGAPFTALPTKPSTDGFSSVANSPKENEYKHRFNSDDNVTSKSSNKQDGFLSKTEIKLKNVLQAPLHLIRKESRKKAHNPGLLGTALENVLMDTVNEILVTSHVTDEPTPPTPPNIPKKLTPDLPCNIEIAEGNAINTMHASFTPFTRTIGSPLPDSGRQEHGHQRTESMGAKMSQSPAKLHGVGNIHRRSSDSDLSITPKGKLIYDFCDLQGVVVKWE